MKKSKFLKKEQLYAKAAKIYSKNKTCIYIKKGKRKKKFRLVLLVAPQITKRTLTMSDKCLVGMEKALSL